MIGSCYMGELTTTAASVGRVKTLSPLSKTAIAVLAPTPVGAGDRVAMQDRGEKIVSKDPRLAAILTSITPGGDPGDFQGASGKKYGAVTRGFYIAVGTLSGLEYSPDAMRQTLAAEQQKGFDAGVRAMRAPKASVTATVSPSSSTESGPSTAVVVGAAVVGLAAVAAVAYKFRKRKAA